MPDDEPLEVAGFADGARYAAARPGYPAAAVDFLLTSLDIDARSDVVDLGAGTGLFTRELLGRARSVIAVEPSSSMRAQLVASLPGVVVLDGRDVEIPLPDASAQAIFVAQAFHWFDAPRALEEIHRVLVDGGGLGLIWNERDESLAWVAELSRAMRWDVCKPYQVGMDFSPVIEAGPFGRVERRSFRHRQVLDRSGLIDRVATTSYIVAMEEAERAELMSEVIRLVERLAEPIVLPYLTEAYRATALLPGSS